MLVIKRGNGRSNDGNGTFHGKNNLYIYIYINGEMSIAMFDYQGPEGTTIFKNTQSIQMHPANWLWFIFIHTPGCSQGLRTCRTSCTFAAAWGSEFQPKDEGYSNPKRNLVEYWICFPIFLKERTLQKRVFFWFFKWIHCCSIPETNGFYQGLHAPRLEFCLETRWHRREGARGVMKHVCVSRSPRNNRGNKMV